MSYGSRHKEACGWPTSTLHHNAAQWSAGQRRDIGPSKRGPWTPGGPNAYLSRAVFICRLLPILGKPVWAESAIETLRIAAWSGTPRSQSHSPMVAVLMAAMVADQASLQRGKVG